MISAILVSLNINVINAQSDKASWTKGWNNKGSVAAVGVGSSIPLYSGNPFTQWRSAFGTWRNYNGRKMDTIGCQVNYGNFLNINAGSFVIGAGPDFFLNNGAVGCGTCIEMYNPDTGRTLTGGKIYLNNSRV